MTRLDGRRCSAASIAHSKQSHRAVAVLTQDEALYKFPRTAQGKHWAIRHGAARDSAPLRLLSRSYLYFRARESAPLYLLVPRAVSVISTAFVPNAPCSCTVRRRIHAQRDETPAGVECAFITLWRRWHRATPRYSSCTYAARFSNM